MIENCYINYTILQFLPMVYHAHRRNQQSTVLLHTFVKQIKHLHESHQTQLHDYEQQKKTIKRAILNIKQSLKQTKLQHNDRQRRQMLSSILQDYLKRNQKIQQAILSFKTSSLMNPLPECIASETSVVLTV